MYSLLKSKGPLGPRLNESGPKVSRNMNVNVSGSVDPFGDPALAPI